MRRTHPFLAGLLGLALALSTLPAPAQTRAEPEAPGAPAPKPLVTAERQMIVAAHPAAAAAGWTMLRRGGSAADAAIAALLVLNVVEPQSSGIGGGAFALVHGPDGLTAWDARETAPAGARPDMFLGPDGAPLPFLEAVASGHAVGVPGLVRLIEALHARHGRLGWAELFAPAIALARDGFPVSPRLAGSVARYRDRLAASPAAALFLPGGAPLAEGAVLRNPALAATFARLAAEGPGAFHAGPVAEAIVAAVQTGPRPGTLAPADLAGYAVKPRAAVCLDYRARFRVCGMGPPSSGATTVGQILGLLGNFALDGLALDSPRLWHLFAEASRLAYADRARYLADPDVVRVPVRGLLDPGYLAARARLIDPERASGGVAQAGDPPWREGRLMAPQPTADRSGTTHLSVIDGAGLAIALTASIETAFGSGRLAAGFLLNNQLTDFAFRPAAADGTPVANAAAPGKRPRSSMAPTIVYRLYTPGAPETPETPHILAGSPGGARIPEYVAGALVAMLDFAADPGAAAALFHISQRNRASLALEAGAAPPGLAEALAALGHNVETAPMNSGLHLVRRRADGRLEGGADPRREGVALGD
ncbi:MAG TPA: gamma-glutamyltransferase family protein [Thermohalobaculum sp.]|nr:gamma-glutamyltransferase family protein [Thermohalobaculum sp.]